MTVTKLAFVDMETLSLPRAGIPPVPWEVAWITAELHVDSHDGTTRSLRITDSAVFQPLRAEGYLADADPTSLRISGFYNRWKHPYGQTTTHLGEPAVESEDIDEWRLMAGATADHWWVGAVPDFDERIAQAEMRRHGLCLATHYHLIDVETYAAGRFGIPLPLTLKSVMKAAGVERSPLGEHTAMGDTIDCVRLFAAASDVSPGGEWQNDLTILEREQAS